MLYRTLGNTGLRISALALGGAELGGAYRPVEEAQAARTVRLALDLGVNLIDTAPYYGLTKAEAVLGRALRGVPRDRYYLATKVGRYGVADFDFSAARVTRSVDESLARLGLDHIDLIQCHDIEFGDLGRIVNETLPALGRVRQQGKARFVGITGLPLRVFRTVLDRAPSGGVDSILSYCHYSLNDTALEDLLPYLETRGVGVLSAAPLSMGLLTDHPLPAWHPAPPALREACARASAHCRSHGADLATLALRFALANERIHGVIAGTADPDELRRNVACVGAPPDPQLLAEVRAVLAPVHNLTWPSGRAENH